MGAWGIMMRDSDDGFEMLDTIVVEQLRKADFAAFNVSEALLLLNQNTQDEIEKCKKKPPSKMTEFYISESLLHNFTRAALLVAECLDDYYRTGELMVYDYVGENYDPIEHHIQQFIVTKDDLHHLLEKLECVQDPMHWMYQCWVDEKTRQEWLKHIQSVQQILKEHMEEVSHG